jgi:two-component system nitrogen regulation response regulator GlnG
MASLLIIDDEQMIHDFLRVALREMQVEIASSLSSSDGVAQFTKERPDVVILDVGLPDVGGLETFRRLHAIDPKVPVIFATGGGTTATAIEAIALGAFEYLLKPLSTETVCGLVARALAARQMMRALPIAADDETTADGAEALLGRCPAMQKVFKAIGRVAPQDVPVLIVGEPGAGKELAARAVYQFSRRSGRPFLRVDCAGVGVAALESELFGHEPAAFTGAEQRRIGKFEQCPDGTLFLDEIASASTATQGKIARVLQERKFERLGSAQSIRTDVRVIAATSRDLAADTASGVFRHDLFYQLNVSPIHLPALRERLDDLPLLTNYFVRRFARELNKSILHVATDTIETLRTYSWPGNVSELQSALKHALLQATGPIVLPEFLPDSVRGVIGERTPEAPDDVDRFIERALSQGSQHLYVDWMAAIERQLLSRILRQTQNNISAAAKILGISGAPSAPRSLL